MKPSDAGDNKPTAAFGARISELRQAAGLTMTVLAEMIGVSEAYISMLESGGRRPSRKVIEKLVAVFASPDAPLLRDQLLVLARHDPLSEAKSPQNSHYEKLLQQNTPDQFQTFLALVNSLIRQGQFALAQTRIEAGFAHFQKTVQLQMLVSYLELSRGNHDAGILAMEAAIQFKTRNSTDEAPTMAELLLNLGVLYFFKGTACLGRLHEARDRNDTSAQAEVRELTLGCFEKARSVYLEGLAQMPEHISLRDELARVCFNLADLHGGTKARQYWQESIQAFQQVLADVNKDQLEEAILLESSCFLAHAYTKAGFFEQACQTLWVITACQPRYAFAYFVFACHFSLRAAAKVPPAEQSRYLDQAIHYLQKAVTLQPAFRSQARLEPDLTTVRQLRSKAWHTILA